MCPGASFLIELTALTKPWRSRTASPGRGGPYDRAWRYGRSQRSTTKPAPANASAKATSRGAREFDPAPWVSTKPFLGESGRCRKPRTGGSTDTSANGSASPTDDTLASNLIQRFHHAHRADFICQLRPAAQNVGIFQGRAPRFL